MTMQDAIALQPAWVGIWIRVLLAGAFILPITLVIWKQSRLAGILTVIASVASAFTIGQLYNAFGYVKLLGLGHIIFWTPAVIFLVLQLRKPDMPKIPRVIIMIVTTLILISLVFDYKDLIHYLLGDRTPLPGTI